MAYSWAAVATSFRQHADCVDVLILFTISRSVCVDSVARSRGPFAVAFRGDHRRCVFADTPSRRESGLSLAGEVAAESLFASLQRRRLACRSSPRAGRPWRILIAGGVSPRCGHLPADGEDGLPSPLLRQRSAWRDGRRDLATRSAKRGRSDPGRRSAQLGRVSASCSF